MANDCAGGIEVLHVVGGTSHLGGVMAFVARQASSPIPGIRQSIWKHRAFVSPADSDANWVREGVAARTDVSILHDLIGGMREVPRLVSWKRRHDKAVLYAHSRMGIVSAALTARLTNAPLMMHLHARAGRPRLYRRLWQSTHATVLFNSNQTCRHYGCDPQSSCVMMPPISWPSTGLLAETRLSGAPRFVASGMFVPWKNFHVVMDAFKLFNESEASAGLALFGSSPEIDSDYQQQITESARGNPIHLMGWDANWTARIAPSDVFVHAARDEPFGIVMLEAFARGCRLVVPQDTFLDDLPVPLNTLGIERAKRLDAAAYREAMQRAVAIPTSSGGFWEVRKKVSDLFSAKTNNDRLLGLYRSLVDGRRIGA